MKSWRAGIGKTLFKDRMVEGLSQMIGGEVTSTSIPVHHKILNSDEIMEIFEKETLSKKKQSQRIFHIDISHEVIKYSCLFHLDITPLEHLSCIFEL